MVEPIRHTSISAKIADRLRREITQGRLAPGARLPGHRELAANFSVGVGSIREAISMLVSEGLVETHVGRGTFASARAPGAHGNSVVHPLDQKQIEELIEAREVLEPQIVALATQRATGQQVQRLQAAVDRMQAVVSEPNAFAEADIELHLAIAEAADNRFLMKSTMDARSLLKRDMELSAEVGIRRLGTLQFSVDTHRRLVLAIAAGDIEKARQTTFNILRRNHEFVLSLYSSAGLAVDAAGEVG